MNYYASAAGFVLLTLAIVAGGWWSSQIYGSVKIDPKVMVAILTWVVYGVSLAGRHLVSWQGPRMASSSVVGFLVILFSMFAVNFWLTKFHVFV
jgi:ABC-type transport system involved in cytochrome c biogenesis permease subunit